MLRGKKIAFDIIQSALQTIDEEEYSRILNHLVSQRLPQNQLAPIDKSTLDSIYRFLTQRGFTLEEIKSAIPTPTPYP